jgi:hypothetical protein
MSSNEKILVFTRIEEGEPYMNNTGQTTLLGVNIKTIMYSMIAEKVKVEGSDKGTSGWFTLNQANVSYDHPFNAPYEYALNIDFVNESLGPSARVAVELSDSAARDLVRTILSALEQAEAGGHLPKK